MTSLFDRIVRWFNLRTVVFIIGVFLLCGFSRPVFVSWLDRSLLGIGSGMVPPPGASAGLSLVELSPEDIFFLENDLGQAHQTLQLLQRLLSSDKVFVGLMLNDDIDISMGLGNVDLAVDNEDISTTQVQYDQTREAFKQLLQHPRLVSGKRLFQSSLSGEKYAQVELQPTAATDSLGFLPPWLDPVPAKLDVFNEIPSVLKEIPRYADFAASNAWPINPVTSYSTPLLFQSESQLIPAFILELYRRFADVNEIEWNQYLSLTLAPLQFPVSADGSFIPFDATDIQSRQIHRYSLAQALDVRLDDNIVLLNGLGEGVGKEIGQSQAIALLALDNHYYFYTPYWFIGLEMLLCVLALFYLMLALPRLPNSAGLFASCLVVVLLAVLQFGWLVVQRQWLPLGVLTQFVCVGHLLIVIWRTQKNRELNLLAAAHGARYQLGLQLFRDGRGDDALMAIRECRTSDAVLSLIYDIAAQQERKRQYSDAVKTYQTIVVRKKHFKDTEEKVEKLIAFSSGGASGFGQGSDVAKTLIVSESTINKPVLGRYEIERELGRGAMGVVYLGRDPKIARHVAIKTLSYAQLQPNQLDEFKTRFFREAEAAGRLNHPNIVTIYDVGEEHDLAFIAMDYVAGDSLAAHITADFLLPVEDVCQIIVDVAQALDYAHQHNIIHRDIKPANIMYQESGSRVKVTDFGVARIVDSAKTSTGDILGSPLYMSPEQLKGERVDLRTDVYSLGVTFYQLLTGALPFNGNNLANLTYQIINEKHKGVRDHRQDLPKSLTRVLNKALQKDPGKRFKNAAEFAEAVGKIIEEVYS